MKSLILHAIQRLADHFWRSVMLTTVVVTHIPLWLRVEYLVTSAGYDLSTARGLEDMLVAVTYLMTSYYIGLAISMPVIGIFREHIQYLMDKRK